MAAQCLGHHSLLLLSLCLLLVFPVCPVGPADSQWFCPTVPGRSFCVRLGVECWGTMSALVSTAMLWSREAEPAGTILSQGGEQETGCGSREGGRVVREGLLLPLSS